MGGVGNTDRVMIKVIDLAETWWRRKLGRQLII